MNSLPENIIPLPTAKKNIPAAVLWPLNQHFYVWSEESFCTKRHYAWDDYSSLSNTEQFSRYDRIQSCSALDVGPSCSSKPLRSRRQSVELKSHLNISVGEPMECNQRVIHFLAKLSVIILDPAHHHMHHWSWPALRPSSGCSQDQDVVLVLCWGHILCMLWTS